MILEIFDGWGNLAGAEFLPLRAFLAFFCKISTPALVVSNIGGPKPYFYYSLSQILGGPGTLLPIRVKVAVKVCTLLSYLMKTMGHIKFFNLF